MTRDEAARLDRVVETLATLVGRFDEQEKIRQELRLLDEKRWHEVREDIGDIKAAITEVPCMMDAKIDACRSSRESITAPAVTLATDIKGFGVVILKVGALAGAATAVILAVGRFLGW